MTTQTKNSNDLPGGSRDDRETGYASPAGVLDPEQYQLQPSTDDDRTIDLLELLVRFLAEWKIGLAWAAVTLAAGLIYTYKTPPQYEATAVILPKQTTGGANSLSMLFSGRGSEDLYTGLLRSRSVTDNVIRELGLAKPGQSWSAQRNALQGALTVIVAPDGLLRIMARSTDAQMAMKIANAYLDALHQQQQTMAMSQSVLNRQFYEAQLDQEKKALIAAEDNLEQAQKRSGIVAAGSQASAGLGRIESAQGQITSLQVQLAALLQSETEDNPQVKVLRSQIAQLQVQERQMEAGGQTAAGAAIPAGRMPEANLEFERLDREVKFHEGLLSSLSSQFQNARLVEASSVDAFQVVDYAIVPESKSYPPRKVWIIFSFLFAIAMGAVGIIFVLIKRKIQDDADYQRHMLTIRQNFGLRR
jgi:tyrosine-protein kinase Etk/Wzc